VKFIKYEKVVCCVLLWLGPEISVHLIWDGAVWLVAEKLKQRGPTRNVCTNWIILEEQCSWLHLEAMISKPLIPLHQPV
jgi:hypothetical protein